MAGESQVSSPFGSTRGRRRRSDAPTALREAQRRDLGRAEAVHARLAPCGRRSRHIVSIQREERRERGERERGGRTADHGVARAPQLGAHARCDGDEVPADGDDAHVGVVDRRDLAALVGEERLGMGRAARVGEVLELLGLDLLHGRRRRDEVVLEAS